MTISPAQSSFGHRSVDPYQLLPTGVSHWPAFVARTRHLWGGYASAESTICPSGGAKSDRAVASERDGQTNNPPTWT